MSEAEANRPAMGAGDRGSDDQDEEDRKPAALSPAAAAAKRSASEREKDSDSTDSEEPTGSTGEKQRKQKKQRSSSDVMTSETPASAAAEAHSKSVSQAISLQEKWDEMFNRLVKFKEKNGHCLVPNRYKEDPSLGSWVATQRRTYKILTGGGGGSSGMNVERATRLNELGFEWSTTDPRHVPWEERYEELKAFVAANGHAEVPMRWEENVQLSNWVSKQRQDYKLLQLGKTSRLTERRRRLLNEVGFVWEISRKGRRLRTAKPIQIESASAKAKTSTEQDGQQNPPSAASLSGPQAQAAAATRAGVGNASASDSAVSESATADNAANASAPSNRDLQELLSATAPSSAREGALANANVSGAAAQGSNPNPNADVLAQLLSGLQRQQSQQLQQPSILQQLAALQNPSPTNSLLIEALLQQRQQPQQPMLPSALSGGAANLQAALLAAQGHQQQQQGAWPLTGQPAAALPGNSTAQLVAQLRAQEMLLADQGLQQIQQLQQNALRSGVPMQPAVVMLPVPMGQGNLRLPQQQQPSLLGAAQQQQMIQNLRGLAQPPASRRRSEDPSGLEVGAVAAAAPEVLGNLVYQRVSQPTLSDEQTQREDQNRNPPAGAPQEQQAGESKTDNAVSPQDPDGQSAD